MMGKSFLGLIRYMQLPRRIQREIALYYLKRIFRISPTDHQTIWTSFFYYTIQSGARLVQENNAYRVIVRVGEKPMATFIRSNHSSDIFVFFQVFIAEGYKPLMDFMNRHAVTPRIIVDAGSNVGYFSQLMMNCCNPDTLIALEPEKNNYNQLRRNVSLNDFKGDVKLWQTALWTHNTRLSIKGETGKEWAARVSETESDQNCEALALRDVITLCRIEVIDVLKIDIEGAEDVLFKDQDFIQMLDHIKILGMEIHDHLADRKQIHKVLSGCGFLFFEVGELTVAWNTKHINAT